jgi:hypothetical protein
VQIPEKIREATRLDEVIEKIGGFELEEETDIDDGDDEEEHLIDDDEAEDSKNSTGEIDEELSENDNQNDDADEEDHDEEEVEEQVAIAISNSSAPTGLKPGRYLIVFKFMEQLTKATMALEEIILLAKELNRTLVIPRVGSSCVEILFLFLAFFISPKIFPTMGYRTIGFQPSVNVFPLDFYFQTDSLPNTVDFDTWWPSHRENISHSVRFSNSKYPLSRCRQGGPHTVTFYDKVRRGTNRYWKWVERDSLI